MNSGSRSVFASQLQSPPCRKSFHTVCHLEYQLCTLDTVFPHIVSTLEQFPHLSVLLPKVTVHKVKFKKEQFPRKLFAEIRYLELGKISAIQFKTHLCSLIHLFQFPNILCDNYHNWRLRQLVYICNLHLVYGHIDFPPLHQFCHMCSLKVNCKIIFNTIISASSVMPHMLSFDKTACYLAMTQH